MCGHQVSNRDLRLRAPGRLTPAGLILQAFLHPGISQRLCQQLCLLPVLVLRPFCVHVQTVTFKVAVVSSGDASLKTSKGVANEVIAESATQAGYLQTAVQPGTVLTNAALFVDSNREELKPIAQTKTFWWWG